MPETTVWDLLLARASDRTLPQSLVLVHPDPDGGLCEAMELARRYLCSGDRMSDCPCGDCRLLRSGNHPDVVLLKPEPSSIKVEPVREMRREAQKPPFQGTGKFFILQSAHTLTLAAANAFLKVLEEPTPTTHFLLLASQPFLLLPTIRSRCFCVPVPAGVAEFELSEELQDLWLRLAEEDTPLRRLQFLKHVSLLDYQEIPRALLGLWSRFQNPILADLAFDYMKTLSSTPATFNRQQLLEAVWRGAAGPKRPL